MFALEALPDDLRSIVERKLSFLSRSAFVVWAAAVGFIAILIGGWTHTRASIEHNLRDQVFAVAQLAAERTALTFDNVGQTLQTIGDDLQPGDLETGRGLSADRRQALQSMLAHARRRNPSLVSMMLLDAGGRVVAVSPNDAYTYTTADHRAEFPALRAGDQRMPTVSPAFRDVVTGVWKIRMTHRLSGPRGGALVASVALDDGLMKFFSRYPVDAGDVISLHDVSDRPLAVFPTNGQALPRPADAATPGGAAATNPADTVRYVRSQQEGTTHLVVARQLSYYPFYVVYGKNVDEWLVRWRHEQFLLALAAIAAVLVTMTVSRGIQRRFALTEQLKKVRGDVEQTNDALRVALAGAELLAAHDQLTGLWNRRNFDQRLDGSIAHAMRHGDTFSLLLIDIDHFKNVNDHYGHLAGDSVLKRFGEVLTERLRQNDVAARWGGEEFVILADGATLENARMMAEQVRESIATTTFSPVARVTVSIGIAEYQPGETGDDLLKRADKALYAAKRNGRNRVMAAEGYLPQTRQSAA